MLGIGTVNILVEGVAFPWINALVYCLGLLLISLITPSHRRNIVITDQQVIGSGLLPGDTSI